MGNTQCKGDHQIHICEMADQDKHPEIKELTDKPNFMCVNCGRVANNKENLCNPVSFDNILPGIPLE